MVHILRFLNFRNLLTWIFETISLNPGHENQDFHVGADLSADVLQDYGLLDAVLFTVDVSSTQKVSYSPPSRKFSNVRECATIINSIGQSLPFELNEMNASIHLIQADRIDVGALPRSRAGLHH